jgi:CspA family cold shock protein
VNTEALIKEQHDPNSEPVLTRLKWFNATKGFGFAVPEEDPCDAFIHITTLQEADIHELGDNALIMCHVVKGPKGALVTKVDKLIEIGEEPSPITFRVEITDDEVLEKMSGTVKWYKPDKGFGFIIPEDGQKDVFVHKSCLERLGIELLIPGQKVRMTVRTVAKGREVLKFRLDDGSEETSEEETPEENSSEA